MKIHQALATLVLATLAPTTVIAQVGLPRVEIVTDNATVFSGRSTDREAFATPAAGTTLEALDVEDGWVWVLLPADRDGTRVPGWVHARHVQMDPTGPTSRSTQGVAAALEAERAPSEARLKEALEALEQARQDYENVKATASDAGNQP